MRVSKQQMAVNRERIVEAASRAFRAQGFDGVSVAEVMQAAGFTHGGFYSHFASKEDLMAQACDHAMQEKARLWGTEFHFDPARPLRSMAGRYLTLRHRDDPGAGCPLASLATDATRQAPEVRHAFTQGLRDLVAAISSKLPGRTPAAKRRAALAAWSTLVGAMVLARAVDDPQLSDEILRAVAAHLSEPG
jgi:TetR/AcrR family transcriptional repressor of nem operon